MNKTFAILILLLSITSLPAQTHPEAGLPFITNFGERDYDTGGSNWAVVKDERGIMYIANSNGILEYDGATWRQIHFPNQSVGRSLARGKDGTIYAGGEGDFGFLAPDSLGEMRFVSLLDIVPQEYRQFNDVWQAYSTEDGVYFQTNNTIYRWNGQQMKIWSAQEQFHVSAVVYGDYFIRQWGVGLMRLENDSLVLVPGGEQFAGERIYVMLPFDEDPGAADLDGNASQQQSGGVSKQQRMLVGTRTLGLLLYDGESFKPFKTEADDYLHENRIYLPGAVLPGGTFALGTQGGGLLVIDRAGRRLLTLNRSNGLADNSVNYVYPDPDGGGLWLGLYRGIAYIETPSPLSRYGEISGLEFPIIDLVRHQGQLYAATNIGTFYLDSKSGQFRLVEGTVDQCYDILSLGDALYVTVLSEGLMQIKGDRAIHIRRSVNYDFRAQQVHAWNDNPNYLFVLLENDLALLQRENGRWTEAGMIPLNGRPYEVLEDEEGNIWVGSSTGGAIRIRLDEQAGSARPNVEKAQVDYFGTRHGLDNGLVSPQQVAGKVYFATRSGLFLFDAASNRFYPDSAFAGIEINRNSFDFDMSEDAAGRVWMTFGAEVALATPAGDGKYTIDKTPFLRFSDASMNTIYPEADGVAWFGGTDALIRYDPSVKKEYRAEFSTLIRKVIAGEDSLIYGGSTPPDGKAGTVSTSLPYRDNNLRFQFAAPTYDNPGATRYQTFLEGFSKHWSSWNAATEKEYTNLPEGDYTFRVRAKNSYEQQGSEATYRLSILPPWYRSFWAYLGYFIGIAGLVFALVRLRTRQLKANQEELERIVEARTEELKQRVDEVDLLSEIGKNITATLSIDQVIDTVYANVNNLMDASVFGIGIYNEQAKTIEMPATKEKGETLKSFSYALADKNRPAVWCFENQKEIFINDYAVEFPKYIKSDIPAAAAGVNPESMIYLPLTHQEKRIGVITAQSFQKNAYSNYHLNILRNLATYAAIALENADAYRRLNATLDNLQAAKQQLVVQEKLASLGQLTAGIAHEIKNPLNFVNNFAQLSQKFTGELADQIKKLSARLDVDENENLQDLLAKLQQLNEKINEHGRRADSIVRSMLQHSRGKAGERQPTDINAILQEDLNLAYHGMRARDAGFNVTMETDLDASLEKLEVVPQDISRVFLNIISNGFYAANKRKQEGNGRFDPLVKITTKRNASNAEIRIRDNGSGIPDDVVEQIFNPFFTTKPTGEGTGLGLSISHDIIVQQHGGEIEVDTRKDQYTEFIIRLPLK